jgi:hypothetical protein
LTTSFSSDAVRFWGTLHESNEAAVTENQRFSELSEARQTLIRLFQVINYGEIRQLQVRKSEPVPNPTPIVLIDLKLDTDEESRSEMALEDFALSYAVCRLFDRLDEVENREISVSRFEPEFRGG